MAAIRVARLMDRLSSAVDEEYASYWGLHEMVREVSELLSRIRLVLPDAEIKAQSWEEIRRWTKEVDGVVQALEELFDEVSIITMESRRGNGKCSSLKLNCFTMKERLIARSKAKHITAELERLVVLAAEFGLKELSVMEHYPRVEDSLKEKRISQSVVGADRDKTRILKHLLSSGDNGLDGLAIVGRSGMRKSTLAQLVFNDDRIQQHFDLKAWACLPKISSFEQVMYKIFTATTGCGCFQPRARLSLDRLLPLFHRRISGKRYLIVLDNVEFVDGEVWRHVKSLLSGANYARTTIIVTTSLTQVAETVANALYIIEGVPQDDSWKLFEAEQEVRDLNPTMRAIAREMVEMCNGNPLLIGILAALLFSKFREAEWMSFKSSYYDILREKRDLSYDVLILTLSYNHLAQDLKNCFASFSLFPTDYEFEKQGLIQYWMAQSFISSFTGTQTQTPEEVGDKFFSDLARRFLFEKYPNKIGCKLPSMVHDFSRHVARDEYLLVDGPISEIHHGIQHISFVVDSSWKAPSCLLGAKRLRSLLLLPSNPHERITELNLNDIFSNLTNLRHLDLAMVKCNSLPSSLSEMKLLKYLALGTSTKSLPDSITVLRHLETLDLRACHQLRQLPDGFAKLYNLRHLRIRDRLIDMPPQFDSLQHLQTLDAFTVGENNGLGALARLKGLAGKLKIYCGKAAWALEAEILKDTKLIDLSITWSSSSSSSGEIEADTVLECLHPPSSLQILAIRGWKEVSFPNWGISESPFFLPNLVSVRIVDCSRCQHLPALSRFPHLRYLQLWNLKALEYIESEEAHTEPYFQSLSCLELYELRQLKGWSRVEGDEDQIKRWRFPDLSCLRISGCPALMSMPLAPGLQSIEAEDIHAKLLKHLLVAEEKPAATLQMLQIVSVQELDSFIHLNLFPEIKSLTIRRCHLLIHLTADSQVPSLSHLDIESSSNLRDMSGALQHMSALKELGIKGCEGLNLMKDDDGTTSVDSGSDIRSSAASAWQSLQNLHSLSLKDMAKLRSLPTGLGCLTMLQNLYICRLYNLRALPEQIQHLSQLRLLDIRHCPKLKSLPKGLGELAKLQLLRLHHLPNWTGALPEWIGNLIDLRHLDISDCPNLMALTQSMQGLKSLVILQISGCPLLTERCRSPDGDDWPCILHIPHITIKAN